MNACLFPMNGRQSADDWLTPGRFAALLALVICATFPDVVLGLRSFAYRDFGVFGAPLAAYHRECFWRGEVPLVNPLSNCGLPYLAQWNTLTCYPLSLIYLVLPFPWSLNLFSLAHLWLAGFSMYLLAFRCTGHRLAAGVAGLAFALNGLTLHALMWPNNIAALGWMPLVVLGAERAGREGGRAVCWAGAIGALQMLTGAPEIIGFTWLTVGGLAAGMFWRGATERRWMGRRLATVGAWVAGLTAVQMLPFADLLMHSQRDRAFGGEAWAMPWWGWANFLVPLFRCTPSMHGVYSQDAQQWTSSYYVGIGVLALSVLAVMKVRRPVVWGLAALAVGGGWLALGDRGGLFAGLKWLAPPLGFVRFPIKWVVLAIFTLPLLAAFGLAAWRQQWAVAGKHAWRSAVSCGCVLLAGVVLVLAWAVWSPVPKEELGTTLRNGVTRGVLLVVALAAAAGWAHAREPRRLQWLGAGLLVVVALDALTHAPRANPTVPMAACPAPAPALSPAPRLGASRAMISPPMQRFLDYGVAPDLGETFRGQQQALFGNCNLFAGLPKVNGFYSLYLKEEAEVQALLYGSTNPPPGALLDFLGVSQISSPDDGFAWQRRETALPLVTAGQQAVFADAQTTLGLLASRAFDPRRVVYLPMEARGVIQDKGPTTATVAASKFTSSRIELEVEAQAPALVVIAQTFHHPWKAQVDGRPVPLWRANHAFQALEVPAGRCRVTLVYRDWAFMSGAVISGLSVGLWGWMGWRGRQRRHVADIAPEEWLAKQGGERRQAA